MRNAERRTWESQRRDLERQISELTARSNGESGTLIDANQH
jgi:hypothetical protein